MMFIMLTHDNQSKPKNIMKLKHYIHNGSSIYPTKYCKTTFLA